MSSARPCNDHPAARLARCLRGFRSDFGDSAALQGLNLTLASRELLCVLGPSGAGKTTLAGGDRGEYNSRRSDTSFPGSGHRAPWPALARRLPSPANRRPRTVGHDDRARPAGRRAVELPLALRGVSRLARRAAREALLDAGRSRRSSAGADGRVCLAASASRVALCAALAHEPALLLADEPTGELDPPQPVTCTN